MFVFLMCCTMALMHHIKYAECKINFESWSRRSVVWLKRLKGCESGVWILNWKFWGDFQISVYRFGTAWGWVYDDRMFIYGLIVHLTRYVCSVDLQSRRHLDSMWSAAQIVTCAQPISRCETDRLWPHRSSADLNNSRAAFYPERRKLSQSLDLSVCDWAFMPAIAPHYLSHPPRLLGLGPAQQA